ncbi:PREDICTED: uncharacterized protein At3g60930, chloroplastic-like [Camelina sativa]|uniref:Uncharacterized protein At3g60930, chloroplastic-like n=1 Tax=Camelina sativa TaxID=90675 RepID=A0ABM1QF36_CAMSA|nr:PREDICTED: uncharacterized protein At3g60930, chloroplastic-like [Camelina sativa]
MASTSQTTSPRESECDQLIWCNSKHRESDRHEGEDTELPNTDLSSEEDRFIPVGISVDDILPLLDHEGQIGGKKTSSLIKSVNSMLNSCGLDNSGVTIIIPRDDQRPSNPPAGYICLYEGYFSKCRLWFPIPALLSRYAQRRRVPICQFAPGSVCNFVAALTIAAEVGVQCFEQLSDFKISKSKENWEVNMRPKHNFLPGRKVSKFKKWADCYFFVRVDQYSFEDPLGFHRRVWNENPDRPLFATRLARGYQSARDALFSGTSRRWELITRRRVKKVMGKPGQSFASSLGQASVGACVIDASSLQIVHPDSQAFVRTDTDPVEGNEENIDIVGVEDVVENDSPAPTLEAADPPATEENILPPEAGERRKKKKKQSKGKQIGDESVLEPGNDKTNCFAFDYFGDYPLVTNRAASGELFRNLKTSNRIHPEADKLKFYPAFLDVAESHFMTAAKINTLTQLYDRQVNSHANSGFELEKLKECTEQIRAASLGKDAWIKELEATLAERDGIISKSELRIGELDSRIVTLEEENAKLRQECEGLKTKLASEVKRVHRDRLEKVEQTPKKAQTRLDKVRAYLVEQDKVRPLEDLLNQATGVQETVQYLIGKGAVIPDEQIAEIDKNKAKAEEAINGMVVLVLGENDLVMSPDHLGYGLLHPRTMAPDSVRHPHGSNAEIFQANLTGASDV